MGRRKLTVPETVEIIDISSEGKGVAKVDGAVIFVRGGIPGDVVKLRITGKKKAFYEGAVSEVVTPSDKRIEARCEHFGACGGCKWQNMDYKTQLFYKQKTVEEAFDRIGKLERPEAEAILGAADPFNYRNKLDFTLCNKRWLEYDEMDQFPERKTMPGAGFHVPKNFDKVVHLSHCDLGDELQNKIRDNIYNFATEQKYSFYNYLDHSGFMRGLVVRNTSLGQQMVTLIVGKKEDDKIKALLDNLIKEFPELTSVNYMINQKKNDSTFDLEAVNYSGSDHIVEALEGLKFKVNPKSFFQTNSAQALELYKLVREYADLKGTELVYDLYTGTGSIAQFIAANAREVVGIEMVPEAIADAKVNAQLNKIENCHFYCGDMKDVFNDQLINKHGHPELLITDPPRAGMHQKVIKQILELLPDRILYVSCNAATQARDLALLAERYKILKYRPVDMFPQTAHVENVVLLGRV